MKKYFYTGETSFLLKHNYKYWSSCKINYYSKSVSYTSPDNKTRTTLDCYINLKTKEITFSGNMALKKYFDKELEEKMIEKEVD